MNFTPIYRKILEQGDFDKKLARCEDILASCVCCGWECKVNRLQHEMGVCRMSEFAHIASYGAHYGEERPISGTRGSGTVFFSGCNLRCQFCPNADISQVDSGFQVNSYQLADIFLELMQMGCHNINLVSPTHFIPQIIEAVYLAAGKGLSIPIVYNTGGYDSLEGLSLLDGIVDIYMPDMKYADSQIAKRYSRIPNYPAVNQAAVQAMHQQVGDLVLDESGIAQRGLLVRHLVLPNGLAGTQKIVEFLSNQISKNTYVNVMNQYKPMYHASQYTKINRRISALEFSQAIQLARLAGLNRFDHLP